MKLQRPSFHLLLFLIVGTGCKVTPPTSSKKISEKIPIDSVTIQVNSLVDDFAEINIYPVLPESISIIGVGDMMLGTNFPEERYLPPDSGKYLLEGVAETLRSADITFGNLEGVILNEGGDQKKCKNPDICYLFRSPEYMVTRIKEAGFDLVSLANNHAGDFGDTGRINTSRVLDSVGINYAGSIQQPYTIFTLNNVKYGFAAFSPNKGTPSIGDLINAKATIKYLDSLCNIVIVSFHGGAEGKDYQHVTRETEYFYGENRGNVYEFSHALIEAGADVVFGHGPHVPRALELYNNRLIAYSLGNFCTYGRFNLQGENAYAPILKIIVGIDGSFQKGEIISAIQTGLGIPKLDTNHRAARTIKSLSEEDFQEAQIVIGDSGVITYIEL